MASTPIRCFVAIAFAVAFLLSVLIIRTVLIRRPEVDLKPCKSDDSDFIKLDDKILDRYRTGLRFQTVSHEPGNYNRTELDRLVQFIIQSYPTLHSSSKVTWQRVANYSLLYHVNGLNPNLQPYLLMAHLDVVPADANEWEQPPFDAKIHNGFIYARGALDNKHAIFGILEAVEYMLKITHPERSFYIAFGHDEEILGTDGAKAIASKLLDSRVELEFILDEGLVVTKNFLSFINKNIAIIGVSEKGYMSLKISANVTGGHSSMPSHESSIGILANAISRLEANPHPSMFGTGPEVGLLEHLASEVSFPMQVVLSNLWLFGPFISRFMSQTPSTNALIRTTTAVTKFNAGIKDNVLAPYAEARLNHRIHPTESLDEVFEFDKKVINDARIQMEIINSREPHPISAYESDSFGYQTIRSTIGQIWGREKVTVVPGLLFGNTDTVHYLNLSKNVYRFSPLVLGKEDLQMFHGVNEKISIENFQEVINFYYHLIMNSNVENLVSSDHSKSHYDF